MEEEKKENKLTPLQMVNHKEIVTTSAEVEFPDSDANKRKVV